MFRLIKHVAYKKPASPVYLIHFVTNRCNAKCRHCFVATDEVKDELSAQEIEKMTKSLGKDIFNVNLTGGEPFLRDDLAEIIRHYYFNARVKSFLIATNGYFTDRVTALVSGVLAELEDVRLTISLSLDDIGDKYDELRGLTGLYQKVIRLYRQLLKLNNRNLSVQINLTLQRDNQDHIESIIRYLVEKEKIRNLNLTLVRGEARQPKSAEVDYQNYVKASRLINRYLDEGSLSGFERGHLAVLNAKNRISRRLIERTVKDKKFISACFAGSLSGVLYASGDVYPCELYPEKIGNIRDFDYDFKALWGSDKAWELRRKIARERCFCTHECNWTTNILFNPKYLPELIVKSL